MKISVYPRPGESLRHKTTGKRYLFVGRKTKHGEPSWLVRKIGDGFTFSLSPATLDREVALTDAEVLAYDALLEATVARERRQEEEFLERDKVRNQERLDKELRIRQAWDRAVPEINHERDRTEDDGRITYAEIVIEGSGENREGELVTDRDRVEVYCDRHPWVRGLTAFRPQVNWAALGSVDPAHARAYAKAILLAADVADDLATQAYNIVATAKPAEGEVLAE